MKKSFTLLTMVFLLVNLAFSQERTVYHPTLIAKPVYFDVSPPLRDMWQSPPEKADNSWKDGIVKNYPDPFRYRNAANAIPTPDAGLQNFNGPLTPDTTIQNFDGLGNPSGYVPPDTYGEVGPNHFFQVVNCSYAIYNKSGVKIAGPFSNSSVWSGMPNNSNDGDATVNYDEVANRWIFSQFSLPNYPNGPFYQMIAISQTPDPTGSWYRYQYQFTSMGDYPKFGIWVDGYYMSTNRFSTSGSYQGIAATGFNRTKMLTGDATAEMVQFTLPSSNAAYALLPSDCDGVFPPMGTPNYFAFANDGPNQIGLYEFHADWTNTANSTFTSTGGLAVNSFTTMTGIPQKNTSVKLDPMSPRLMYRLQFRKFSDHWSMVANHTVMVSSTAAIRWYEFRNSGAGWSVYQQGTYSPDANSRWEGSIAMDTVGNIALGYSISSSTMFPAIRYTGRLAGDPLGTLTIAEGGIYNGSGYQGSTGGTTSRWGDYSGMSCDPSEIGKFWYTTEYYTSSGGTNWKTRIGSFSFMNIFSANATAAPDVLCAGMSTQLNVTATGGSGTYTYSWTSLPAGFTAATQNPTVTPTETTKYIAHVNDGVNTKIDTVLVTVNTDPTSNAGNDATYPNTAPMIPVSGQATSYSHTQWLTAGDGTFNFDTLLVCLYSPGAADKNNGGVDLTLKAFPIAPCATPVTDVVHITLTFGVGIGETSQEPFGIKVTPNPTSGILNLHISGIQNQDAQVTISDIQGKPVYQELVAKGKNSDRKIDLSSQPKGVYLIKVKGDHDTKTEKLVLE